MNSQVLCFLGLQPVRPRVHCGIYISGDQRRDHATGGAPALEDDDELELLCEEAGATAIDVSAYGNTGEAIAFTEAPLVHEPGGLWV